MAIMQNISDRAFTDVGAALLIKENDKYHLLLPVTNIPATGSAPEQVEKTVTTENKKSYVMARQDSPQKEFTFYAHRDNFLRLEAVKGVTKDFMQVNPDGTGFLFSGQLSYYQDEVSVGSNIEGKAVITVTSSTEAAQKNVVDLIEPTALFDTTIPDTVIIDSTNTTFSLKIATDPSDATITVASDTTGVATVALGTGDNANTMTITRVATGTAVITINVAKTNYASNFATILVISK